MAYIKEYWAEKENRAIQAKKHTEEMEQKYQKQIITSAKETMRYNPEFSIFVRNPGNISYEVIDMDSVQAVIKYAKNHRAAVLNFSSYKNPGGMFLKGSKAQEECLCHKSFLYNVLTRQESFYEWNNQHKNKALYLDRGLYSPNILFFSGEEEVFCDVITCAAPNKSAAQKYQSISDTENTEALRSRIRFLLDIAYDQEVEILILGAYGCGVFGQDPIEVASIFKEYLKEYNFKKVIFAIPKGKNGNYEAFKRTFI